MRKLSVLQTLEDSGGSCKYQKLVEGAVIPNFYSRHNQRIHSRIITVGEEHECDTVGAMLKILKNKKKIQYDRAFLMYPHHKNDIIALKGSKSAAGETTDGPSGNASSQKYLCVETRTSAYTLQDAQAECGGSRSGSHETERCFLSQSQQDTRTC